MSPNFDFDVPPLFRCADDQLEAGLLGHYDGISSWTLNAAADPSGGRQSFVSHHERAHHQLHAGAPWGTAMLATGLTDKGARVAVSQWEDLARTCLETHEAYATFAAVAMVPNGLDALTGNLRYLQHLRNAKTVAEVFNESVADAALHLVMHLLMSPQALINLTVDDLRRPEPIERLVRNHAPDRRFALLRRELGDDAFRRRLRGLTSSDDGSVLDVEAFAEVLTRAGIPTAAPDAVHEWTTAVLVALRQVHPSLISEDVGTTDRLTSLLEDQQRERVQMNHDRLELRTVVPAQDGSFPIPLFARTAAELGPHIWLAWLHPDLLRRQFVVRDDTLGDKSSLGLLACDRTHEEAHASWLPWPAVPPGMAAHLIRRSGQPLQPLLFTTWRTLETTPDETDFRGFEPGFILIDTDVLTFLTETVARRGQVTWSVVGASGDRTVDVLALEERSVKGVISLLVCSSPTSQLVSSWMRRHPETFRQDSSAFQLFRPQIWALTKHLLGTFWIFDMHGWK
ncbi:MAG TPA: hypothetical protein VF635_07430 [Propionibacteriaceae bacterium]|jgi:hypothetical protein